MVGAKSLVAAAPGMNHRFVVSAKGLSQVASLVVADSPLAGGVGSWRPLPIPQQSMQVEVSDCITIDGDSRDGQAERRGGNMRLRRNVPGYIKLE